MMRHSMSKSRMRLRLNKQRGAPQKQARLRNLLHSPAKTKAPKTASPQPYPHTPPPSTGTGLRKQFCAIIPPCHMRIRVPQHSTLPTVLDFWKRFSFRKSAPFNQKLRCKHVLNVLIVFGCFLAHSPLRTLPCACGRCSISFFFFVF